MATNLTTIQVQLIANAKDFKKNVDGAKSKKFKKTTKDVAKGQQTFQERLRNVSGLYCSSTRTTRSCSR